nr:RNA-directed DNA polymerase, eukaryota [Tanacetum cinerariifolium]
GICKEYGSVVDVYIPFKKSKAGNIRGSFAYVLKEGAQKQSVPTPSQPALVLDDSCLKERDFSSSLMGQVKEVTAIPNLYTILSEEGFQSAKLTYLGGKVYWIRAKELDAWVPKFISGSDSSSSEGCFMNQMWRVNFKKRISTMLKGIVTMKRFHKPVKKDNIHQTKESDPTHPPGFIPERGNNNKEEGLNYVNDQRKSVSDVVDNLAFDHAVSSSVHNSGGILCVWDFNMFIKKHVSSSDYFLAIMGTWTPTSTKLLVILVYAPQELSEKREMWGYLYSLINSWDGETVVLGDFNEIQMEQERFGSMFNIQGANAFINFISLSGLVDLALGGYSYTWAHKSASKMSKIDRFLISEGLLDLFPHLSGLCLDRYLSDHRPLIMFESKLDYGPVPFRVFHSWFKMEGFDKFVEDTWDSMNVMDSNGLIHMKKKLQLLKNAIKCWVKEKKKSMKEPKFSIKCKLTEVDKLFDRSEGDDEIRIQRASLLKDLVTFHIF